MHVSSIVFPPVLVDVDCLFECPERFLGMAGGGGGGFSGFDFVFQVLTLQ